MAYIVIYLSGLFEMANTEKIFRKSNFIYQYTFMPVSDKEFGRRQRFGHDNEIKNELSQF